MCTYLWIAAKLNIVYDSSFTRSHTPNKRYWYFPKIPSLRLIRTWFRINYVKSLVLGVCSWSNKDILQHLNLFFLKAYLFFDSKLIIIIFAY